MEEEEEEEEDDDDDEEVLFGSTCPGAGPVLPVLLETGWGTGLLGGGGCAAFVFVVLTLFVVATLLLFVEEDDEEDAMAAWRFATSTDFKPLVGRPRFFNSTRSFATVSLVGSTILFLKLRDKNMCGGQTKMIEFSYLVLVV